MSVTYLRAMTALMMFLWAFSTPHVATAQDAGSDESDGLVWDDEWPRFRAWEGAATGGVLVAGLLVTLLAPEYDEARWSGGILFDDLVRDGIRGRTDQTRSRAPTVTTYLHLRGLFYPFVIDTLVVTLGIHRSPDVAGQTFLINLEAYAFSGVLALLGTRLVGRGRPLSLECPSDPAYSGLCDTPEQFRSFPGGHAAIAVTFASVVCLNHRRFPLYGGGWPDALMCGVGIGSAAVNSTLRMVADRHWFSDIVVGASIGFVGGWLLPRLLHYGFAGGPFSTGRLRPRAAVVPMAGPSTTGLSVVGAW